MLNKFSPLLKKINIEFKNDKLLENVFVHRSYLNEHKKFYLPSNEKLEFLGDSVLSLITTIYLYKNYPNLDEGNYTDIKAAIVRTESLGEAAKKIKLGDYLYLSKGEHLQFGKDNINILADSFEALVGAVFIDQGFDTAFSFVSHFLFEAKLHYIVENKLYLSPKSRFQEYIQAKYKILPIYRVIEESGPEHLKHFSVAVFIREDKIALGSGNSKKAAEEAAAKKALEKMENLL